jgi:hypothetical protein
VANGDDPTRTLLARMQALGHIRLAHGVVGKTSVVTGLALLVLAGIAWRVSTDLLLVMGGMVLLIFFVYLAAVLWFAHRHPEQALLEGAEIIQYREQEMAAKGVPELPRVAPTTPPELPPERKEE